MPCPLSISVGLLIDHLEEDHRALHSVLPVRIQLWWLLRMFHGTSLTACYRDVALLYGLGLIGLRVTILGPLYYTALSHSSPLMEGCRWTGRSCVLSSWLDYLYVRYFWYLAALVERLLVLGLCVYKPLVQVAVEL